MSLRVGGVPQSLVGGVLQGLVSPLYGSANSSWTSRDRPFLRAGRLRDPCRARVRSASTSDLTIYLLGSVFGALCHQNGMLPLHASAVEVGGEVTAFLGDSGSGKSSLVALLGGRGYRIFADDICLLEPVEGGLAAGPLAGWLKLWRGTFEQLGEEPEVENRTFSGDDKYRMYLAPQGYDRLRVGQFCFLVRAEGGQARLEPLGVAEAIGRLVAMIYPGYVPEDAGEATRLFRQCAQALAGAKAFELVVPWGWDRVEGTLDLLERELGR